MLYVLTQLIELISMVDLLLHLLELIT
ncbi:hypothetical protein LINGRAHAP2_LOCUS10024 [Linum grandiflorum]